MRLRRDKRVGVRTLWSFLQHELESLNYDRSCQTTMYI